MLENIPLYVVLLFSLTTLLTLVLFYSTIRHSILGKKAKYILLMLLVWVGFHAVLSYNLVYLNTANHTPPLFPFLGFIPSFILMFILFTNQKGRAFIDSLSLARLTIISLVRIPVEIVLWCLFLNQAIPEIMTFEGQNFDILAGISAPFIFYFGFIKKTISSMLILIWNIISLLLLLNIIFTALLSFPTIIQLISFHQPNVGLLYFPFFWLPSVIVPIVLFAHFVSIRQLLIKLKIN